MHENEPQVCPACDQGWHWLCDGTANTPYPTDEPCPCWCWQAGPHP